jgi:membrane-associated phospholipid phosphatase
MIGTTVAAAPAAESRPWVRAICWLLFLTPFFYLSYGAANEIAASRLDVPSIVFDWERQIPFLAWTIVPYWSINAFYGLSLLVCSTRAELDGHARRLVTAQIGAVACFVLFPLKFTFRQPHTTGLPGFLFDALTTFDKPFNQAPSLHIALLVILWKLYSRHLPRAARWPLHLWFALVGVSVLTTYQHHFFDIPTGALLGAFCLWLWPDRGKSPFATFALTTERRRLVLAARYLIGAALLAVIAVSTGGAGLWLLWPGVSLGLVAANYAVFGPEGFQKDAAGRMSLGARLLLAPYLAGAFVNSRSWTRHEPAPVAVSGDVWLGRIPRPDEAARFPTVIDLCAELPGGRIAGDWMCIPMLDLVPPQPAKLLEAAASIERARANGPVLVCCALGYSRSAATVATWLLASNGHSTVGQALATVREARPRIVIDGATRDAIASAAEVGA